MKITLLPGDGIGPEIIASARAVLEKIADRFGHHFDFCEKKIGGCAIDDCGEPLPQDTLRECLSSDAVLLGAVGGPKWGTGSVRPEQALLGLRKEMGLFANLRPASLSLPALSPLKSAETDPFDLLMVRELTGGIYFGQRGREQDGAFDTERYTTAEIERIGRMAFSLAKTRRNHVTSVDKANVLETSRLWRETMHRLQAEFPEVEYEDMLVDNAAMQLVKAPSQFDVIVTSNLFGDILSDEAAQITGSIGLLPSASLGTGSVGLYEPIHGSAPDIAGRGIANPCATVLSAAMMLELSFGMTQEAEAIRGAVRAVLGAGFLTADLTSDSPLSTEEMTKKILGQIA